MQCICERSCKLDVVFFRNGLISWNSLISSNFLGLLFTNSLISPSEEHILVIFSHFFKSNVSYHCGASLHKEGQSSHPSCTSACQQDIETLSVECIDEHQQNVLDTNECCFCFSSSFTQHKKTPSGAFKS